jgi:flagellar secretion chaperone FliS
VNAFARNSKLAAYQSVSAQGAVANADPHGLVMMLMDAALQRMSVARGCMERGQMVQKSKLLYSSVTLIAELRGSLNLEKGGPLAQNLSELYGYMVRRLVLANATNDAACIGEVHSLMREIRGAWAAIGPQVRQGLPSAAAAPAA